MPPDERIAAYVEQLIFLIVSVRCQLNMGGIQSVFAQLLRDKHTREFFTSGLHQLGEPSLADAFTRAHAQRNGARREAIADEIRAGNLLWELDETLCGLLPE